MHHTIHKNLINLKCIYVSQKLVQKQWEQILMKFSYNTYTHTAIQVVFYALWCTHGIQQKEGIHLQKLCKFIANIAYIYNIQAIMLLLKLYLMQQFFSMDAFNWMLHLKPDFILKIYIKIFIMEIKQNEKYLWIYCKRH